MLKLTRALPAIIMASCESASYRVLVLCFLLLTPVLVCPQDDATKRVTIGAWNLEWLGTQAQRSGTTPRADEDLRTIATIVADVLDMEVVVFVEINTGSQEWATLKTALEARGFKFIEGSGSNQRVVIAYDDDEVDLLASTEPSEPDVRTSFTNGQCSTSNARKPLFGNFKAGNFDFTLIGVHLKSGRPPDGCTDDTFTGWVRGEQAGDLIAELARRQQVGTVDPDAIIIGDFNGGLDDPGVQRLRTGGFRILTEDANRAESSGTLSYRKGSFKSQLDHIAIRPLTDREWVARSAMWLPGITTMTGGELAAFRQRFSDHGPVWAEFLGGLPDDD